MTRVVVVGGGYGGVAVARALDEETDVVLVEPKDAFVHAVGALRAVVDRDWQHRVFHRYDGVLRRGRVVQDWARLVSPGVVRLSSSERLDADVVVLATGTGYPFPAKYFENAQDVAAARLDRMREELVRCEEVLVVGAGAVGLELAGELTYADPNLRVTVLDQADRILSSGDWLPELRDSVQQQLEARGVRFVLGARLGSQPPFDVGRYGPFTVDTTAGQTLTGQMWFRCYGSRALSDYLDDDLAELRHDDGTIRVTRYLSLVGQDRMFAVGDLTDVDEDKRATAAADHAEVVVQNIRDLLAGRSPSAVYTPAPQRMVLPLGPIGGASQVEQDGVRVVLGPDETAAIKGADLFSTAMEEVFGRR